MKTKVIVSAINSNGEPDLFFCIVECTEDEYNDGLHYDAAKDFAEDEGYFSHLTYDENDSAGKAMLPLFVWETATVIQYDFDDSYKKVDTN